MREKREKEKLKLWIFRRDDHVLFFSFVSHVWVSVIKEVGKGHTGLGKTKLTTADRAFGQFVLLLEISFVFSSLSACPRTP